MLYIYIYIFYLCGGYWDRFRNWCDVYLAQLDIFNKDYSRLKFSPHVSSRFVSSLVRLFYIDLVVNYTTLFCVISMPFSDCRRLDQRRGMVCTSLCTVHNWKMEILRLTLKLFCSKILMYVAYMFSVQWC